MAIPVYGLTWHFYQSSALRELLITPMSPFMQFEQLSWGENGDLLEFHEEWLRRTPIIFFQMPPPESILNHPDARITWIPMWDQAREYDLEWWRRLPKSMRVVSFSKEISHRARSVGLDTLDLRYSIYPVDSEQTDWGKPRTLFYWNRTGMVGEDFLYNICETLDVEILLFRHRIDPRIPSRCDYGLPKKLGKTVVKELTFAPYGADAHREYLKYLNQANIFIAPRLSEGVGLSFIEALARGCAVFAYDAPTMNEYITHKSNGYLLQKRYIFGFNTGQKKIIKWLRRLGKFFFNNNPYPVTEWQNWAEIKKLELTALGNKARQEQLEGYAAWKDVLPNYARFILDWK